MPDAVLTLIAAGGGALLCWAAWRWRCRVVRRRKWQSVQNFRQQIVDPRAGGGVHTSPHRLTVPPEVYRHLQTHGVVFLTLAPPEAGLDLSLQEESRPYDAEAARQRLYADDSYGGG